MPLIRLETSESVVDSDKAELARQLSDIAASAIGKPLNYVMATVSDAVMSMGGTNEPAAFLDVRSIGGLNQKVNRTISQQASELLLSKLGIPANRVYLCFTSLEAQDWGWNGSTFG